MNDENSLQITSVQDADAEFEALTHTQEGGEQVVDADAEFVRLVNAGVIAETPTEAPATLAEALAEAINAHNVRTTSEPTPTNADNTVDWWTDDSSSSSQDDEESDPNPEPLDPEEPEEPEESAPMVPESTVLPPNGLTSIYPDLHTRFRGAEWFEKVSLLEITLIGCGGIGTWAALSLCRLGIREIILYDGDRVEPVNMAGQLFSSNNIGNYKVNAVSDVLHTYCGYRTRINAVARNFFSSDYTHKMTIGALDNMNARKLIYERWLSISAYYPDALFIDGRLSANALQVFAIPGGLSLPDDDPRKIEALKRMKEYEEKWLFDQSEGEETVCSFKQTTYMAQIIGGLIANLVVNFVASSLPDSFYSVPFFTTYESDLTFFKSINL